MIPPMTGFYTVSAKLGEFRIAPPAVFQDFLDTVRVFADAFDFASAAPACLGNFSYATTFIGNAVLPYAVVAAVGCGVHPFAVARARLADAWDRCRGRHTRHKLRDSDLPLRPRLIGAVVWLLYFLFPSPVMILQRTFAD